jgi:hypothetical protein
MRIASMLFLVCAIGVVAGCDDGSSSLKRPKVGDTCKTQSSGFCVGTTAALDCGLNNTYRQVQCPGPKGCTEACGTEDCMLSYCDPHGLVMGDPCDSRTASKFCNSDNTAILTCGGGSGTVDQSEGCANPGTSCHEQSSIPQVYCGST